MLTHLLIQDLVIVQRLDLTLSAGMTALTGETGAGKSVLINALSLTLGDRVDPAMIRTGCDRGEVHAHFDLKDCPAACDWLQAHQIPTIEQSTQFCIKRILQRRGRARAFINEQAVTSTQLRQFGELLVDIHGQHAHQSLLRSAVQRDLLDTYANHQPLLAQVAECYHTYHRLDERWRRLTSERDQRNTRSALLRFQVEELALLNLVPGELEDLDVEHRRLAHLEQLRSTIVDLLRDLYEGDGCSHDRLSQTHHALKQLIKFDHALETPAELVDTATTYIKEAVTNLRHYLDALQSDPKRFDYVESRLSRLYDVARKYRIAPQALCSTYEEMCSELQALDRDDASLAPLVEERLAARQAFMTQAQQLTNARRQVGERLSAIVTESMQQLGMIGGRFLITVQTEDVAMATMRGLDRVEFLVSTNPGQTPQPLAKIVSGGELSRMSLAIQVATATCGHVPTLVFDEVDVGIGGRVAETVGRLLRDLGQQRQILCITHLPQVAAQAHHHCRVKKYAHNNATFTTIEPLPDSQRVDEIARMLGGATITATTRAHAEELLAQVHCHL
jgi:DNA repair protein RecN (Recombination protein N)